jgi:glycosyltransferase 2 family protein
LKKAIKWIKYIVFLGIGVLLLVLAFNNQNPRDLLAQLKEVDYLWVWLSILFGFLAMISRGLRWVILLENMNYEPKPLNSIYAVAIGYFTNLAIPRAGEVTRCTSLNQTENIPVNKLFGTIILERTIDFILLIILICTTFLLKFDAFEQFFLNLFADSPEQSSSLGFFAVAIISTVLMLFLIFKKRLKKTTLYIKVFDFLQGVKDGFKSIKGLKNKWAFWGHTLFIWLMYYLMTYVCFFAIEGTQHLHAIDGLFTMVVGGLGMVAPVQGGIGAYHLVVKIGLMILGIAPDSAILFATVVHTAQTLMTLFIGSTSLLLLFLSKRKANREHIG